MDYLMYINTPHSPPAGNKSFLDRIMLSLVIKQLNVNARRIGNHVLLDR